MDSLKALISKLEKFDGKAFLRWQQ